MKRTRSVVVAAAVLAMVLFAGSAMAGGESLQFSRKDIVAITGFTNLAVGDRLLVEVASAEFTPTVKGNETGFSGASGTVVVEPGSPLNTYRFEFDVSGFSPGLYYVTVTSLETSFQDSGQFVLPWTPVPTATTAPPTAATSPVTPSGTTVTSIPVTSPTQTPLLVIISLAAIIPAAWVLRVRR